MKNARYYAKRLYQQAVTDPSVNAMDSDELWAYIEAESEELFLDKEAILKEAKKINRSTSAARLKRAIMEKRREQQELSET
jgi:hypothetical protein